MMHQLRCMGVKRMRRGRTMKKNTYSSLVLLEASWGAFAFMFLFPLYWRDASFGFWCGSWFLQFVGNR